MKSDSRYVVILAERWSITKTGRQGIKLSFLFVNNLKQTIYT